MRILAFILDPVLILKILRHLGDPAILSGWEVTWACWRIAEREGDRLYRQAVQLGL
jgi:hypothetical protein